MKQKYLDIINMPHHTSINHQRMSSADRAAQFAPFAALSGHDEAINETARRIDSKVILDESRVNEINEKLNIISDNIKNKPRIYINHFVDDLYKKGGKYVSEETNVLKIDNLNKILKCSNILIKFEDIYDIEIIKSN